MSKKNSSSTASVSTPTLVSLTTELFPTALERYIEDYKPDPLSCKQLEGWTLEWNNTTTTHEKDRAVTDSHQNVLQGELNIGGSYMVVILQVTCAWSASSSSEDKDNPQYGSFYYACRAAARFWTKSEFRKRQKQKHDDDDGTSSRNKKAEETIRTKTVARLREDAYISKLLSTTLLDEHGDDTATTKPVFALLAHANIQVDGPNDLEERVDVSEDMCEAVKRAVWSSAESPLDVVELLLQLPCLPTTTSSPQTKNATTTTPLANRAKLRLLEDAMVDACEKVGEDGILDDLKLSNDHDASNGGTSSAASSKKNKSNDTSPRKKSKRTL
jgi:hypothetical protein